MHGQKTDANTLIQDDFTRFWPKWHAHRPRFRMLCNCSKTIDSHRKNKRPHQMAGPL